MEKDKLIEKLKAMPLTQKQIEAILTSLTAPVPDGKEESNGLPYRKCSDCGTEYYSNGRCPECNPL